MRSLLCPDWVLDDYTAVTPQFLRSLGIRLLLADLDYTLAPRAVPLPDGKVRAWLEELHAEGILVVIVSNNRSPKRVKRFCEPLNVPYLGHAQKPLRGKLMQMIRMLGETEQTSAVLGDKLLTDVLGARNCRMPVLMVEPLGGPVGWWNAFLHTLQEPFKRACAHDLRKSGAEKKKNTCNAAQNAVK